MIGPHDWPSRLALLIGPHDDDMLHTLIFDPERERLAPMWCLQLIEGYAQDLKDVQQIFHKQKDISAAGRYLERPGAPRRLTMARMMVMTGDDTHDCRFLARPGPPLFHNFPPVAGACFWVRGLKERVELPMVKLRQR
eukprot:3436543-Prymnesium_polylepis.1